MRRGRLVKTIQGAVVILGGLVCLFSAFGLAGLRINTSPSLPVGIYIVSSEEAALVEFCPLEPWAHLAATRGYRSAGTCWDGAAPLLKPIVARPGDTVVYSSSGIRINGKLLGNTAPRREDSHGRILSPWPFGTYHVALRTLWVASS